MAGKAGKWDASIWECINEPGELDILRPFLHVCLPSPPFSLNSKCKMTPKSRKAPFVKGYAITTKQIFFCQQ